MMNHRRPSVVLAAARAVAATIALALVAGSSLLSAAPASAAGTGFRLTTYFTPAEALHGGAMVAVVPTCPDAQGNPINLGRHSQAFLDLIWTPTEGVKEGTGRMSNPPDPAKPYLANFDAGDGHGSCWRALAKPLTSSGLPVEAMRTAAGDAAYANGTFRVKDCGRDFGQPIPQAVCDRVKAAEWQVTDTGPAVQGDHMDLYVGDENAPTGGYRFDTMDPKDPPTATTGTSAVALVAASSPAPRVARVRGRGLAANGHAFVEVDSRDDTWVANARPDRNGDFSVDVPVKTCEPLQVFVYDGANVGSDGREAAYRAWIKATC